MKTLLNALAVAGALQLAILSSFSAETAKTYQVTGPILELTDKAIVVQKGDERWEVARDEKTRIDGDLKDWADVSPIATAKKDEGSKGAAKLLAARAEIQDGRLYLRLDAASAGIARYRVLVGKKREPVAKRHGVWPT